MALWLGWYDYSLVSAHRTQQAKAYAKRHDRRIQRRQAARITTQSLLWYYDDLEQDRQEQQDQYLLDQYYENLANEMDNEIWEDYVIQEIRADAYHEAEVYDPYWDVFDYDYGEYEEPSDYDRGFEAGFKAGRESAIEELAREEYGAAARYRTEMRINHQGRN